MMRYEGGNDRLTSVQENLRTNVSFLSIQETEFKLSDRKKNLLEIKMNSPRSQN